MVVEEREEVRWRDGGMSLRLREETVMEFWKRCYESVRIDVL